MPKSLFRIKRVTIEGFKAFTKRQSFDLEGRHVFFFGENGLGKTSVVEAIRWCLFGLASRQGGTIKNQFHGGQCIVELTLEAPDGMWSFQRRLRECRHIHRHSRESGNPKAIGSKCVFASYRIPGSRFRGDDGNRRLETDILKLTTPPSTTVADSSW